MAFSQAAGTPATMPKVGSPAPALGFNHLLGAPAGAKADWPSLRGKVVVLEFWATWCAPCIAEIPVLNALQASLDPAKVQFISVDDEDPAVVAAFLKKKPIAGWVGIDTSSKVFGRYGLDSRPATFVIGPDGRVVSSTLRPEQLKREQLLALAKGRPVKLDATVDPKVQASLDAGMKQAFAAQTAPAGGPAHALFEINVTPGDQGDGHILPRGPGQIDITNSPVKVLLSFGAEIPMSRIKVDGVLPDKPYNLHVDAPKADPKTLKMLIEAAIESGTGVHIEHHTETVDAYVLAAQPGAQEHFTAWQYQGGAMFHAQTLMCIHATSAQVAGALEEALGAPVVDETGLAGRVMTNLTIAPKDVVSAKAALETLGLTLSLEKRSIETVILSAAPEVAKEAVAKP
jgi:uncharacterized protein (TIGR03435 family)